jgi:uncharacterized membrane protein
MSKIVALLALFATSQALAPAPKKPASPGVVAKTVGKQLLSGAVAASLLFAPQDANAARSGGRAGGGSRMRSAPSRSYSSAPRAVPRGGTRMYAAPMAVPVPVPVSPFGMGYGYGGYGYGGPNVGAIVGLSIIDSIAQEQRRSAYIRQQLETQRELGRDQADIDQLTKMLAAQDARIAELQKQVEQK